MTYTMRVLARDGEEVKVLVKHNKLDIKVLVAKAILQSEWHMNEVLECTICRG